MVALDLTYYAHYPHWDDEDEDVVGGILEQGWPVSTYHPDQTGNYIWAGADSAFPDLLLGQW